MMNLTGLADHLSLSATQGQTSGGDGPPPDNPTITPYTWVLGWIVFMVILALIAQTEAGYSAIYYAIVLIIVLLLVTQYKAITAALLPVGFEVPEGKQP